MKKYISIFLILIMCGGFDEAILTIEDTTTSTPTSTPTSTISKTTKGCPNDIEEEFLSNIE